MITAIRTVHLRNGVWVTKGGYEYNLVLLASLYAIADVGPGHISLDALRGKNRAGAHWALAAVGFGASARGCRPSTRAATRSSPSTTPSAGSSPRRTPESSSPSTRPASARPPAPSS